MTAQDSLLKNIAQYITLTNEEASYFSSILHKKVIKRKQLVLHTDSICTFEVFVVHGCLRSYSIDDRGVEHILSFSPENWWAGDIYSLITKTPSTINIDALENTEVLLLFRDEKAKLLERFPKFERLFRTILEKALASYHRRVIDYLSLKAEDRYLKFRETYPALSKRLPQKQIAAFIGVTPEFMSKLRKSI